ncbi:MAG: phytoene/squalene synthase family protein, partial [Sneathiella sp.]
MTQSATEAARDGYLSGEVKRYDYDRWLTTLYAPPDARHGIFALLAFHAEIARIRETVSESLLGDIRLQWWRDALNAIAATGAPPVHPVAEALAEVIPAYNLDPDMLHRMIDIRATDLDPLPFRTTEELIDYADQTGGTLNRLVFRISGGTESEGDAAARAVGKAYALTGIIRAIPYHVAQDVLRIPDEMIRAEGLTADSLFSSENRQAFFKIVGKLTDIAMREQETARRLVAERPKSEKPMLR